MPEPADLDARHPLGGHRAGVPASSQNHLVKGERECQASTNHRL